jgi:hypothetical protein
MTNTKAPMTKGKPEAPFVIRYSFFVIPWSLVGHSTLVITLPVGHSTEFVIKPSGYDEPITQKFSLSSAVLPI